MQKQIDYEVPETAEQADKDDLEDVKDKAKLYKHFIECQVNKG